MNTIKILNVVGARPNFMKIAPLYAEMQRCAATEPVLLHTGQHYDHAMSELFFENLGLPEPDRYLGVGSGSHGTQTGKIMIAFEQALDEIQPDLVLVVGDVNSTIACGLVAVKKGVKLIHVEAGLRSFDRSMPEEVNRVLTDQISDYLFTTEAEAHDNLLREGIDASKIFFVGNVMIDTLLHHRERASGQSALADIGVTAGNYGLVTLHRPSNVDDRKILLDLIEGLSELARQLPLVFPVHPRTRQRIQEFGIEHMLLQQPAVKLIEPLGYLDFLQCMDNARLVVTDSGGIQEETTALGVPCVTARNNTERPVTVTQGTNVIVGQDSRRLLEACTQILNEKKQKSIRPELWDGEAARRIIEVIVSRECRDYSQARAGEM